MKKNKMMRIASVLLVAVLLSTCAISGTFAKYVTTFEGTDTAKVATWAVTVNGIDQATKNFTFDILQTITDTDDGDEAGNTDDDVLADRLAPGTKGSFTIVIKNTSEVNATYATTFDFPAGTPITFTPENTSGNLAMSDGEATVTVNWEWPFDQSNDAADMALAGTDLTVTATVTVTQVN